jgi:broad specificity phosphatase PhoE
MAVVYFITHPEVVIDPTIPVPDWLLSPTGRQRMRRVAGQPWLATVRFVFSSAERKAMEAAGLLAGKLGCNPMVIAELGENDRSATGYLPKPEFEAVADEFFARPEESVRGWERAIDAQRRIVGAVERSLSLVRSAGDVAIVSHGGVGALLLAHLKAVPICRDEDQPADGGGNVYSFRKDSRQLLSGWRRIDA